MPGGIVHLKIRGKKKGKELLNNPVYLSPREISELGFLGIIPEIHGFGSTDSRFRSTFPMKQTIPGNNILRCLLSISCIFVNFGPAFFLLVREMRKVGKKNES